MMECNYSVPTCRTGVKLWQFILIVVGEISRNCMCDANKKIREQMCFFFEPINCR